MPLFPTFDDKNSLANSFGSFFIDKIKKIRDTFKHTPSKSLHPDKELLTFISFQGVTETEVLKFIKEAPSKTCSLDPCPTHIVKKMYRYPSSFIVKTSKFVPPKWHFPKSF